jgi:hypothetical protein
MRRRRISSSVGVEAEPALVAHSFPLRQSVRRCWLADQHVTVVVLGADIANTGAMKATFLWPPGRRPCYFARRTAAAGAQLVGIQQDAIEACATLAGLWLSQALVHYCSCRPP